MGQSHITLLSVSLLALGLSQTAHAAPLVVVDGSKDAAYGAPLAVQTNTTGFGDSTSGTQFANGSEIDAAYGVIYNGRLYLLLAGNLESNFNKLDIFIDSQSGGMNRLTPIANNQGNFNRMADDGSGNGLTFDAGFTADHWISVTGGGATPDIFVDYGNLVTAGNGFFSGQTTPLNGTLINGNGGPTILATWNNVNAPGGTAPLGGITNLTAPNDAALVTTGVEVSIALADIGDPSGNIVVSAFVNGSSQDFLSNQVAGPLVLGTGNLGEPRNVNFNNQAGLQQFVVPAVPEPASIGLLGLIGLVGLRRKR